MTGGALAACVVVRCNRDEYGLRLLSFSANMCDSEDRVFNENMELATVDSRPRGQDGRPLPDSELLAMIENQVFIPLVQARRPLWDPRQDDYKNSTVTDRLWGQIQRGLRTPGKHILSSRNSALFRIVCPKTFTGRTPCSTHGAVERTSS